MGDLVQGLGDVSQTTDWNRGGGDEGLRPGALPQVSQPTQMRQVQCGGAGHRHLDPERYPDQVLTPRTRSTLRMNTLARIGKPPQPAAEFHARILAPCSSANCVRHAVAPQDCCSSRPHHGFFDHSVADDQDRTCADASLKRRALHRARSLRCCGPRVASDATPVSQGVRNATTDPTLRFRHSHPTDRRWRIRGRSDLGHGRDVPGRSVQLDRSRPSQQPASLLHRGRGGGRTASRTGPQLLDRARRETWA